MTDAITNIIKLYTDNQILCINLFAINDKLKSRTPSATTADMLIPELLQLNRIDFHKKFITDIYKINKCSNKVDKEKIMNNYISEENNYRSALHLNNVIVKKGPINYAEDIKNICKNSYYKNYLQEILIRVKEVDLKKMRVIINHPIIKKINVVIDEFNNTEQIYKLFPHNVNMENYIVLLDFRYVKDEELSIINEIRARGHIYYDTDPGDIIPNSLIFINYGSINISKFNKSIIMYTDLLQISYYDETYAHNHRYTYNITSRPGYYKSHLLKQKYILYKYIGINDNIDWFKEEIKTNKPTEINNVITYLYPDINNYIYSYDKKINDYYNAKADPSIFIKDVDFNFTAFVKKDIKVTCKLCKNIASFNDQKCDKCGIPWTSKIHDILAFDVSSVLTSKIIPTQIYSFTKFAAFIKENLTDINEGIENGKLLQLMDLPEESPEKTTDDIYIFLRRWFIKYLYSDEIYNSIDPEKIKTKEKDREVNIDVKTPIKIIIGYCIFIIVYLIPYIPKAITQNEIYSILGILIVLGITSIPSKKWGILFNIMAMIVITIMLLYLIITDDKLYGILAVFVIPILLYLFKLNICNNILLFSLLCINIMLLTCIHAITYEQNINSAKNVISPTFAASLLSNDNYKTIITMFIISLVIALVISAFFTNGINIRVICFILFLWYTGYYYIFINSRINNTTESIINEAGIYILGGFIVLYLLYTYIYSAENSIKNIYNYFSWQWLLKQVPTKYIAHKYVKMLMTLIILLILAVGIIITHSSVITGILLYFSILLMLANKKYKIINLDKVVSDDLSAFYTDNLNKTKYSDNDAIIFYKCNETHILTDYITNA